jgi:hypothetical protein
VDPREERDRPGEGGYIGNRPERAEETIPGGVRKDDDRVAGHDSQSSGEGKASDRQQGDDSEWPGGHRDAETPPER